MFTCVAALLLGASARITDEGNADWKELGKASTLETVNVLLVLKRDPAVLEKLEKIFWEVSDPRHEKYGEHLTQAEVTELMGIGDNQLNAVTSYLKSKGAEVSVGAHRDLIRARLGIASAEEMFTTSLYKFQNRQRKTSIIRARENVGYALPDELKDYVYYVDGLTGLPKLTVIPTRVSLEETANKTTNMTYFPEDLTCDGIAGIAVTPKVLADRYKTNGPLQAGLAHGRMGVAEFQNEYWSMGQIGPFNQYCQVNSTVDTQVGYNNPEECNDSKTGGFCTEALLDIEYIKAVAGAIPLTDVSTGGYSLLEWADTIGNMDDDTIPWVNSISYGNDEQQNYKSYMESCNVEFQKLGVRGVSIMFAAGDQGVWGREGLENGIFHPDFPGASPYVTAVGGTNFAVEGVIGEEEAWTDGGGGFSDTFEMPSYQAEAVAAYKKQPGLPAAKFWNQGNARGYPDVSALAGLRNPYLVHGSNHFEGVGGTSAATPVFSAVIAKLNSMRLAKGGKPLGFLNPWLYQNADAFNDVTLGNNGSDNSGLGFPATKGWDAATGLGTPNFEMLSQRI